MAVSGALEALKILYIAISQRYYQAVLISKASYMGKKGKNWLLNTGTSSQSVGCSSK